MKPILTSILVCSLFIISCRENKPENTAEIRNSKGMISCTPTNDKAWYVSGVKAPKLKGLEGISFNITTSSPEAQKYFNQGLMLSYGFNHAEAARSFYEVTRIDSNCAMGYWGFAFVLGPNYNAGMEPDNYERAYTAIQKAIQKSHTCTPREKDLIQAMGNRYSATPTADRSSLDIAYADAMKANFIKYPGDPDIGAMYAESIMNLHPWDLYDKKTKEPKSWTKEILRTLKQLMAMNPSHPGAHHYYIHALEASAAPEKAYESAKILLTMVPGSGHLIHMASHIYINTGDYHEGSLSNIEAVKVDSSYLTACHAQGAYPLSYYPHNYHFLAATATLEGNASLALKAADQVKQHTAKDIMEQPGWGTLQHYYSIPWFIAVKFGLWDKILSMEAPKESLVYPRAIFHYARGMAFLGKKDRSNAEKEWQIVNALSKDSSLRTLSIWGINYTSDIAALASKVLAGEMAAAKNDLRSAIRLLQEAVAAEDQLNYDEPPDWFFSVRHHLGNTLLKSGDFKEAENVFRQDLKKLKRNGWALIGLQTALQQQGKAEEALMVKKEFEQAWQYADTKIMAPSPL
jgi:tetratricopeptide (TPR) repeat protein